MFRAYKPVFPSPNIYLKQKWDLIDYEIHRRKVRMVKAKIDQTTPRAYMHLYIKPKLLQKKMERLCTIYRQNSILMNKVATIQRRGGWTDHRNYYKSRATNTVQRQKNMMELCYDNQTMLNRIRDTHTSYNRHKFEDDFQLHLKYKAITSKYPRNWSEIAKQMKTYRRYIKKRYVYHEAEKKSITNGKEIEINGIFHDSSTIKFHALPTSVDKYKIYGYNTDMKYSYDSSHQSKQNSFKADKWHAYSSRSKIQQNGFKVNRRQINISGEKTKQNGLSEGSKYIYYSDLKKHLKKSVDKLLKSTKLGLTSERTEVLKSYKQQNRKPPQMLQFTKVPIALQVERTPIKTDVERLSLNHVEKKLNHDSSTKASGLRAKETDILRRVNIAKMDQNVKEDSREERYLELQTRKLSSNQAKKEITLLESRIKVPLLKKRKTDIKVIKKAKVKEVDQNRKKEQKIKMIKRPNIKMSSSNQVQNKLNSGNIEVSNLRIKETGVSSIRNEDVKDVELNTNEKSEKKLPKRSATGKLPLNQVQKKFSLETSKKTHNLRTKKIDSVVVKRAEMELTDQSVKEEPEGNVLISPNVRKMSLNEVQKKLNSENIEAPGLRKRESTVTSIKKADIKEVDHNIKEESEKKLPKRSASRKSPLHQIQKKLNLESSIKTSNLRTKEIDTLVVRRAGIEEMDQNIKEELKGEIHISPNVTKLSPNKVQKEFKLQSSIKHSNLKKRNTGAIVTRKISVEEVDLSIKELEDKVPVSHSNKRLPLRTGEKAFNYLSSLKPLELMIRESDCMTVRRDDIEEVDQNIKETEGKVFISSCIRNLSPLQVEKNLTSESMEDLRSRTKINAMILKRVDIDKLDENMITGAKMDAPTRPDNGTLNINQVKKKFKHENGMKAIDQKTRKTDTMVAKKGGTEEISQNMRVKREKEVFIMPEIDTLLTNQPEKKLSPEINTETRYFRKTGTTVVKKTDIKEVHQSVKDETESFYSIPDNESFQTKVVNKLNLGSNIKSLNHGTRKPSIMVDRKVDIEEVDQNIDDEPEDEVLIRPDIVKLYPNQLGKQLDPKSNIEAVYLKRKASTMIVRRVNIEEMDQNIKEADHDVLLKLDSAAFLPNQVEDELNAENIVSDSYPRTMKNSIMVIKKECAKEVQETTKESEKATGTHSINRKEEESTFQGSTTNIYGRQCMMNIPFQFQETFKGCKKGNICGKLSPGKPKNQK